MRIKASLNVQIVVASTLEVLDYNSEELEALKEDMAQEVKSALEKELNSIFKKWK